MLQRVLQKTLLWSTGFVSRNILFRRIYRCKHLRAILRELECMRDVVTDIYHVFTSMNFDSLCNVRIKLELQTVAIPMSSGGA